MAEIIIRASEDEILEGLGLDFDGQDVTFEIEGYEDEEYEDDEYLDDEDQEYEYEYE